MAAIGKIFAATARKARLAKTTRGERRSTRGWGGLAATFVVAQPKGRDKPCPYDHAQPTGRYAGLGWDGDRHGAQGAVVPQALHPESAGDLRWVYSGVENTGSRVEATLNFSDVLVLARR